MSISGIYCREGKSFEVPADKWESKRVAIIGGGIAGLSGGVEAESHGPDDFVVLELEKEPGGTSRSETGSPVGYPWGAHYLPVPFDENRELNALLDEMSLLENGRVKEQFLCREPEERVFYKGRWYEGLYLHAGESEDDKRQYSAFKDKIDYWVNWRDAAGRRAFVVPFSRLFGRCRGHLARSHCL